ncbi:MAG TPA: CoA-transferase [Rhodocyclaceae bacterium]|nr:CoA-transferase [Rhodocyclaceae bacterium]
MNAVFPEHDKRVSLDELAFHVKDGDWVAVGGGLSSREPMALLRALIRAGRRNLQVVGSAHGIDIDLLCGASAVKRSAESYVGFEQDFGMAPNYRRACESGEVEVADGCCYTVVQQLRAAAYGLPFLPIRSVRGTSFEGMHSEYVPMTCPYTGEELLLVPALQPDVALIHAQYGDAHGNLRIEGPPVADILAARASKKVIATVERIVSNEELQSLGGANVPYFYVAAVAEVPFGAHPTACYPMYAYDRPHTAAYYAAASAGAQAFKSQYLEPFVFGCPDHQDYLERIGGSALRSRLSAWDEGNESWMNLYREDAQ